MDKLAYHYDEKLTKAGEITLRRTFPLVSFLRGSFIEPGWGFSNEQWIRVSSRSRINVFFPIFRYWSITFLGLFRKVDKPLRKRSPLRESVVEVSHNEYHFLDECFNLLGGDITFHCGIEKKSIKRFADWPLKYIFGGFIGGGSSAVHCFVKWDRRKPLFHDLLEFCLRLISKLLSATFALSSRSNMGHSKIQLVLGCDQILKVVFLSTSQWRTMGFIIWLQALILMKLIFFSWFFAFIEIGIFIIFQLPSCGPLLRMESSPISRFACHITRIQIWSELHIICFWGNTVSSQWFIFGEKSGTHSRPCPTPMRKLWVAFGISLLFDYLLHFFLGVRRVVARTELWDRLLFLGGRRRSSNSLEAFSVLVQFEERLVKFLGTYIGQATTHRVFSYPFDDWGLILVLLEEMVLVETLEVDFCDVLSLLFLLLRLRWCLYSWMFLLF